MLEESALLIYRAIAATNDIIANATTLDEALKECLRSFVEHAGAQSAVLWRVEESDERRLRPYYWLGPVDLAGCSHLPGEGSVGRVFATQKAERLLAFDEAQDPHTAADFAGMEVVSMVCVPFSSAYESLGVIQFVNGMDNGPITDKAADVMEILAMTAALSLDEADAFAEPWKPGNVIMRLRDITREFVSGEVVTKVLKGVNLDVYEGEFLVLLGESGCGKSTLLNIIGAMDSATSGTIECLGQDLSNATEKELCEFRRSSLGFIFQAYNLMPNLTSHRNLTLISELVEDPMDADDALEMVGLSERKKNYPSQMSGGQQQRISIARALVKHPKIILADEPTAALDHATSVEVLQLMEHAVEEGTTMVMVTHNEEIARMANRVVRMRDGRMYEVTVNRHPAHATDLVW